MQIQASCFQKFSSVQMLPSILYSEIASAGRQAMAGPKLRHLPEISGRPGRCPV